jgi:hypothetical protein
MPTKPTGPSSLKTHCSDYYPVCWMALGSILGLIAALLTWGLETYFGLAPHRDPFWVYLVIWVSFAAVTLWREWRCN